MGLIDELINGSLPVMVAPLAGYHDPPQAKILSLLNVKYMIYPFVSADGLMRRRIYREEVTSNLLKWKENIADNELHVQIFGSAPEMMSDAASYLENEARVEILNINAGCSVRKIWKTGSGSMLLKNPNLALNIIKAICERVKIPVTIKIRTGWDRSDENGLLIISKAHDYGLAAVILHPRRGKEKFLKKAEWGELKRAVEISKLPVVGNGDIKTPSDALRMIDETGVKGVMTGRASIGNPWIFPQIESYIQNGVITPSASTEDRINMCLRHVDEIIMFKGEEIGVKECRKHIGRYLKGLPDATTIRFEIIHAIEYSKVRQILYDYKEKLKNLSF